VIRQLKMATLAKRLDLDRLIREGGLSDGGLDEFLEGYLAGATQLHHPGFMGHQVAVPHPLGAIAALIDASTNNAMNIYEMGPSAATIEFAVVNWMLQKIGWVCAPMPGSSDSLGSHTGGVLTHGGSLGNLTALMAARSRVAPNAWQGGTPGNLVIVAPEACHYSIARAVDILGVGRKALKTAPTDPEGRLIPDKLAVFISSLQDQGASVLAVVANGCSTAAGLYDRLREIGPVCREMGVWLHVDGAHGASALVSEHHRMLLDGVGLADSLSSLPIWDQRAAKRP
jgi:L-2,4-diaminobutyrate decarboxylase